MSVAELGEAASVVSQKAEQEQCFRELWAPGPSWPTIRAPPVLCPGWNLEEEGAASEPQKGLHWDSWTKSFTSHQPRLPLLDGR